MTVARTRQLGTEKVHPASVGTQGKRARMGGLGIYFSSALLVLKGSNPMRACLACLLGLASALKIQKMVDEMVAAGLQPVPHTGEPQGGGALLRPVHP